MDDSSPAQQETRLLSGIGARYTFTFAENSILYGSLSIDTEVLQKASLAGALNCSELGVLGSSNVSGFPAAKLLLVQIALN
jgi:hypothetical protein